MPYSFISEFFLSPNLSLQFAFLVSLHFFRPIFVQEERKMILRDVINKHPYYDDVDEYYLGLSNESEYEKAATNPLEKEFGDDLKITSTQRYRSLKIKFSRTSGDFGPEKRRGSEKVGFTSKKTQVTDQEAKSTVSSVEYAKPNTKRSVEKKTAERKRVLKTQRIDIEDDLQRSSKKTKKLGKRVDFQKLGLYPAPDFSYQIKSCINYQEGRDSEIKLRIMKQMFQTDMDKHQERFSMPLKQIMDGEEFLNDKEMEEVSQSESNGTEVKLVELGLKDGNVHQSTMRLRRRQMNNCISYVLTSNWNDVLDRNKGAIKLNDIVQVYSFRRDDMLWLVLAKAIWLQKLKLAMAKGTMRVVHGVDANTGSGSQTTVDLRC